MYNPNFSFTPKLINNIAEISAIRQSIIDSNITKKQRSVLKKNAIINSTYNSNSIDGNPLTENEVKKLYEHENLNIEKQYKNEILNYIKTLKKLNQYKDINQKTLISIHKDITSGALKTNHLVGRYREGPAIRENFYKRSTPLKAPQANDIEKELNEFFYWFNNHTTLYPVILAGIAHYELLRIYPFNVSNGKTIRVMTNLIFKKFKFDDGYFSYDEYYNKNRVEYLDILNYTDKTGDLTEWLKYFSEGILKSLKKVKKSLDKIPNYSYTIELNRNELAILDFLKNNSEIRNRDVVKLLNLTPQAAYNNLKSLENKTILKSVGKGRSVRYVLN